VLAIFVRHVSVAIMVLPLILFFFTSAKGGNALLVNLSVGSIMNKITEIFDMGML